MELNRTKAPDFQIPADFYLPSPELIDLRSGIKVFFFPTPGIDAVKLEVIGKSGRDLLSPEKMMIPSFTIQMILEGIKGYSERNLSEFFDFHATEVQPILSFLHEGLSLLTTKRHFEQVFPTFISLFSDAVFPAENLEKRKSQRKLGLKLEREKSSSRSSQLFRQALFGENHLFGQEITETHIDLVTSDLLQDYYRQHSWFDLEVFLCGDLSKKDLEFICEFLESLPVHKKTSFFKEKALVTTQKIHEERQEALQSSIRMGGWSIPKSHADFHALSVFNTILGGYFGSRLVKNIREDKGHTYGISSSLVEIGDYNYWVIGADVQKKFLQEVVDEVYLEIKKMTTELISQEELDIVRNYLIGQMLTKFSSSFDLMDRFKSVHFSGMDFGYYRQKMDFLQGVNSEDLLKIGHTYFSNPPFVEVTVG